jgi:protein-S-isoprenylcysteine O-methyltransferase Ste14
MTLQRWVERIAEKEVERITAKCRRYQEQGKPVPVWVRAGMDERFRRVEQVEQRVQMLLGIFASHGVPPLEFKPAYSVGDLLLQHLDVLEQEAEEKGGVQQLLDREPAVERLDRSLWLVDAGEYGCWQRSAWPLVVGARQIVRALDNLPAKCVQWLHGRRCGHMISTVRCVWLTNQWREQPAYGPLPTFGELLTLVKAQTAIIAWRRAHDTRESDDSDADARRPHRQRAGHAGGLPRGDPTPCRGLALATRLDLRPLARCAGALELVLSVPQRSCAAGGALQTARLSQSAALGCVPADRSLCAGHRLVAHHALGCETLRLVAAVPGLGAGGGGLALVPAFYLIYRATVENTYLSTLVRVQAERGQRVISTGIYGFVRHPLYLGCLLMLFGAPLLLGSLYGLLIAVVSLVGLVGRIVGEERTLTHELEGYEAYRRKVKYRLVPLIW